MRHVVCVFLQVSFLVSHPPDVCDFLNLLNWTEDWAGCSSDLGLSSLLGERPLRLLFSPPPCKFRILFLYLLDPGLLLSRATSLSSLSSSETLVTDALASCA